MIGSASCSPAGPGLSAYTLIVETKTQRASRVAATALRTCATSLVAARALARPGSRRMALIGNGAQAEFQALASYRPAHKVRFVTAAAPALAVGLVIGDTAAAVHLWT